ncbi:DUF6456 domain-containing protein [Maricaulaceae bacterium NA33B04]|nr:DUF6456 domain-containing protein [Maricaulaceae bacterium NA33B04]
MMVPAWMRHLAKPERVLALLPGGRGGYGVYAGTDRRRRPLARVSAREMGLANSADILAEVEGGYRLSLDGLGRLQRLSQSGDQPFADQHRKPALAPVMEERGLRHLRKATTPGPLARYLKPSGDKPALLQAVHANAADIFIQDYERSSLTSRVTADWSAPPGGKHRSAPADRADASTTRLDAQTRVMDALDAMGPGLDQLVFAILIRESGMGQAERDNGWPERAGAAMLKLALDRLAVHYRLLARPKRPA